MRTRSLIPALLAVIALPALAQDVYKIDAVHSQVGFKVRHFVAKTAGRFTKFEGVIKVDTADIGKSSVEVSIDAASVNTDNEGRDKHLRSADFFDVEQHPHLHFTGTDMKHVGGNDYTLTGDLTIKGITKPVTLEVEFGGKNTDPWGNEKLAFALNGRINRKDWGLNWNAALETGGVLVSDEVRLSAEVQFVKQA